MGDERYICSMVIWLGSYFTITLRRALAKCPRFNINVNVKRDSHFFPLLKVFTARMASTGQAFWYVHTWWKRWTGGKDWPPSITLTAVSAGSQSSEFSCMTTQTIQHWDPPVARIITLVSKSPTAVRLFHLIITSPDIFFTVCYSVDTSQHRLHKEAGWLAMTELVTPRQRC